MKKVLSIFGTRPEAIKMAPIMHEIKQSSCLIGEVCITSQHKEMLNQVLQVFDVDVNYDLNIMKSGQSLYDITIKVIGGLKGVIEESNPDIVLVHGDTTTTMAASIAAFYKKIPVGHVEAGLRSGDIYSPWPEEGNRRVTGVLASYHFVPTEQARYNLIKEGVDPERVIVTGNTVIDALLITKKVIENDIRMRGSLERKFSFLKNDKKTVLVTSHRRENFGQGIESICIAIEKIVNNCKDVQVVFPVHPNPNIKSIVYRMLSGIEGVFLIEPQDYISFVYLMMNSYVILTDSGGIQEEAPSLGKPVLVMRDVTERPEAVIAGSVKLVGTDPDFIFKEFFNILENKEVYEKMASSKNPYGDGRSAMKIIREIESYEL